MKPKTKVVKAWAIYNKEINDLWINTILQGDFARGILIERIAKFFRPENYAVVPVTLSFHIPQKAERKR